MRTVVVEVVRYAGAVELRLGWLKDNYNPRSVSGRFRARRWKRLCTAFPQLADYDVLDIGGRANFWVGLSPQPRSVTVTNLPFDAPQGDCPPHVRFVTWDTFGEPPAELLDRRYHLVHCNSVIEHVGDAAARARFAASLNAFDTRLWIQTPNRYFPVEPHWMFPFFQFLPRSWKVFITRHWPLAYGGTVTKDEAGQRVDEVELITASELGRLFPRARLVRERFLGLTKSLVAVRPQAE